jgi:hypothetical protein
VGAGAIKLYNPLIRQITVNSVTVDIGPVLGINPWSNNTPFTIPGGGTAILTQTPTLINFNTSGIATTSCTTPDGYIPKVHVTLTMGTQHTFYVEDTGQVLNTGGVDKGECPPGSNEGHQWVPLRLH